MTIVWNLRDARGTIWHDLDAHRLRAWVARKDADAGIRPDRPAAPFRSESTGYGYAVPTTFRY